MKKTTLLISLLLLTCVSTFGQITLVADNVTIPNRILSIGNELYISERDSNISKINLNASSTAVTKILRAEPNAIALKGNELYYSNALVGKIFKFDITAASPTPIEVVSGLNSPLDITFRGNELYISEFLANKISKINVTDARPTPVDVVSVTSPLGIVFSGNDLYISKYSTDEIAKTDVTMASPVVNDIFTGIQGPDHLLIDGNFLYISENIGGNILRADITAASPSLTNVLTRLRGPAGMLIIGNTLYFCEQDISADTISKVNLETLSNGNYDLNIKKILVTPNPSSNHIKINGLTETEAYRVYNILGSEVSHGILTKNDKIDIQNLTKGMYFLKFKNRDETLKFIKK